MRRQQQKLYKVKVETQLLVLATDKQAARRDSINSHILSELAVNKRAVSVIHEVQHLGQVPPGWMEKIPYANHFSRLTDRKTVKEFIQHKLFRSYKK